MYILFSHNKTAYEKCFKKAQLAPFFIALITIVIITLLVTVNLSKIAQVKTYTGNAVDAGALAGASQLAFAFNQLALQATGMYASYQAYLEAIKILKDEAEDYLLTAEALLASATALIIVGGNVGCVPFGVGWTIYQVTFWIAVIMLMVAEIYFAFAQNTIAGLESVVDDLHQDQQETYADIRESMQENFNNADDVTRDYAFLNSGISQALNDSYDISGNIRDEATTPSQVDEFSFFIGVKDTPETFCWRDGMPATSPQGAPGSCQGSSSGFSDITDSGNRLHVAGVTIADPGPPEIYQLITTVDDMDAIDGYFDGITYAIIAAIVATIAAYMYTESVVNSASTQCVCCSWHVQGNWITCVVPAGCWAFVAEAMVALSFVGAIITAIIFDLLDDIWDGVQECEPDACSFCDSDGPGAYDPDAEDPVYTDPEILVTISDVDKDYDNYTVETFQEHQGQNLGLWQTKYPKVKADARAGYGCNLAECSTDVCAEIPLPDCNPAECGTICDHDCSCIDGRHPCIAHEPILLGVDEFL